ncbi:MAG TPA: DUF502 domain-containing protein [Lacipirellula sp.]
MRRHFSVWKTTILGGVIFLLPFAIVVFLIGQLAQLIYSIAAQLDWAALQWSVGGVSLAVLLATLGLVLLCYLAGLAARRSLGRQFSEKVERNLSLLFPRYVIWKSQLASNVGADEGAAAMRPVLVTLEEVARIGFEVERTAANQATVYLPGAPDPWTGHVVHVDAERIKPLALSFAEAAALCESMGRGASAILETSARDAARPTTGSSCRQ